MNAASPIEAARERFTIPELWETLNLPGQPGKSCHSPFRDEKTPSFSVFNDGQKWKDFSTGEGGDSVDFIAAALSLNASDAARWLIEHAGGAKPLANLPPRPKRKEEPREPLSLPALDSGSYGEVLQLKDSRALPLTAGIEILIRRGLLGFFTARNGERLWLLSDAAARNAQARRLNGSRFDSLPGQPKAKTLRESEAAWPIGAEDCRNRSAVLLVEGGPDMLAAASLAWWITEGNLEQIGFACITGASNKIHPEALPIFEGKRIRIFVHADSPGRKAAGVWLKQLRETGADADCAESETPGYDLNDEVSNNWPPEPGLLPQTKNPE